MRGMNVFAEQLLFNIGQISLTTALVILPLLALRKLLRKRYPARVLCLVWAVLIVRLLVPVQLTLPEAPVQVSPRLTQVSYARPAEPEEGITVHTVPRREWVETAEVPQLVQASKATYYGALLFLLWVCGVLWQLSRQFGAYARFSRKLRRTAWAVEAPELVEVFQEEAERLHIRRNILLMQSTEADGPMLAGLRRPMLLLPASGIDPEAAPLVLRHELIHYQRRDLWLKLAATAAQCLHWFNPAVYLLTRALFEDIELACDSKVVEGLDNESRKRYGRAILDCAETQSTMRQTLTTCFTSDKETLKTRLGELFATGVKKRGIALLVVCALTVGIVGGAVSIGGGKTAASSVGLIGGNRASADSEESSLLSQETLSEEIAAVLAGHWGKAMMERNYELVMPYLLESLQRTVFESACSWNKFTDEKGNLIYEFDPDAPHYGVPEEVNEGFWRFGASSPYVNAYTVEPDLENGGVWVVLNWHASASIDYRSACYLKFTRDNGEWRISEAGETYEDEVGSAENFRLLYGNDLGLPDFLNFVSVGGSQGNGIGLYDLSDPVSAAEQCLFLRGGSGEVTGQVMIRTYEHMLGNDITYTFADGSQVIITMSSQYGEGYIPVDWRIEGKNNRTMVDLAAQWARGVMYKDTHAMFPLLNEQATDELIAVQQDYSSTEGDEWYWKHGLHGSSPDAVEFGVFPGEDAESMRIVYELWSGGYRNGRLAEVVRFEQTPAGLKIKSVRELTDHIPDAFFPEDRSADYEEVDCTGLEWFRLLYPEQPLAGNLSEVPDDYFYRQTPAASDPLGQVKWLMDGDMSLNVEFSLASENGSTALVRGDFQDGSGTVFLSLQSDIRNEQRWWRITEITEDAPDHAVHNSKEFAEVYGGSYTYSLSWKDGYRTELPADGVEDALENVLQLTNFTADQEDYEVFDKQLGVSCEISFLDDGSNVNIVLAEGWDGNYYPVDWSIDGKYTRKLQDLAEQWAAGVCEKETRLMFPILTEKCAEALLEVQKNYSGDDWTWKHGRYGSSPTATAFAVKSIDDHTAEVVYNEVGGGYFNHRSVERLYFVEENGRLRIDRWEEIERTDESDFEWYQAYYEAYETLFESCFNNVSLEETVLQLAGLENGDGLEAVVEQSMPHNYVTVRFADGSGGADIGVYAKEDSAGGSTWELRGINMIPAEN